MRGVIRNARTCIPRGPSIHDRTLPGIVMECLSEGEDEEEEEGLSQLPGIRHFPKVTQSKGMEDGVVSSTYLVRV